MLTSTLLSPAQKTASLVAAAPLMVCLLLPLVQFGGVVYVYDIVSVLSVAWLQFPRLWRTGPEPLDLPWLMLVVAVLIGCVSAMMRSSGELRPIAYTVQYLLALAYARSVYLNIRVGRVDIDRMALGVLAAACVLACIAVAQFFLFRVNPELAASLYRKYLTLSGFSQRFFEQRYLTSIAMTGVTRVVGTWDVATTFGGMMGLSAVWLLVSRVSDRTRIVCLALLGTAALMSNSRHAWIVMLVVLFGVSRGPIGKRLAVMASSGLLIYLAIVAVDFTSSGRSELLSFHEQLSARVGRTFGYGIEDNSIQARYYEGTARFISHALKDPSILLVGFGIGTEKALIDRFGLQEYIIRSGTDQFGFVSNGWFLIWRNWGIAGLAGLVLLFRNLLRNANGRMVYALVCIALIIGADNYAIHVARCFLLVIALLAVIAAQGAMGAEPRTAIEPFPRRVKSRAPTEAVI